MCAQWNGSTAFTCFHKSLWNGAKCFALKCILCMAQRKNMLRVEREREREQTEERFPIVFYSPDYKIWRDTKCQWKMCIKMHMKHLQYFCYAFLCPFIVVLIEIVIWANGCCRFMNFAATWFGIWFILMAQNEIYMLWQIKWIHFIWLWFDLCINKFISTIN